MSKDSTTAVSLGLTSDATLDPGPTSHAQWGAIAAGSLAGFGATLLMATLGLAIAATTGAFDDLGFGAGLAVWSLLSALVAGFAGGAVLNRMARHDRPYMPMAFGALTWAGGMLIALLVGAASLPGLMGGAAAAGLENADPDLDRAIPRANGADPREAAAGQSREGTLQRASEKAATGAAAAAWVLLGAQLVSLAATLLAASWRKPREIPVKVDE